MKALLYIFALASIIAACTSVDCSEKALVECTYDVVDASGDVDTIPNLFSVSTKRSIDGNDTTLINLQSKTTAFNLPLSYSFPTDTLYFTLNDTTGGTTTVLAGDKVYISKTNTPHYEGYECAAQYWHTITKVWSTHNFIDTLKINNNNVNNDQSYTNIHLRLRSGY